MNKILNAMAPVIESKCKEIQERCGSFLESILLDFNWYGMAMDRKNIIIVHVRWDEDDDTASFDNPTEAGMYLLPKPNALRRNKEFCKLLRQLAKDSCCDWFAEDVKRWLRSRSNSVYADKDEEELVIYPQDMLDLWDKLEVLEGFEYKEIK